MDSSGKCGPGKADFPSSQSVATDAIFALLDDCSSNERDRTSRLYTGWRKTLAIHSRDELARTFTAMQAHLRLGLHAVGCFTYELGAGALDNAAHPAPAPQAEILLFERCERLSSDEVVQWLRDQCGDAGTTDAASPAGIVNVRANVGQEAFEASIAAIKAYLEAGDSYQVNYTYRLAFESYGYPASLYLRLRQRQPVPYGALLGMPDGRAVLSLSPELFLNHANGWLTARPMKGTAAASGTPALDQHTAEMLRSDVKTRAENLMIVDLLRNDLGRIAQPGTVSVPTLFEVDRFGCVLQMTSTIAARLRAEVGLAGIFDAVYPCGSITGAPKLRTMEIIGELETVPRGLYTGAIGWFDAPADDATTGNFCLSVPIRTLVLQAADRFDRRSGEMGVGAGIVHDSVARAEFEECQLKSRFLTGLGHQFELFETMFATGRAGIRNLDLHVARLRGSANTFAFPFDEDKLQQALRLYLENIDEGAHRLKLSLDQAGAFQIQSQPLVPLSGDVDVVLAAQAVSAPGMLSQHKTSSRRVYDCALQFAQESGAFDALLYDGQGRLLEGGRSNLFLYLDGCWFTPPLSLGILPGVMRSVLLADHRWHAREKVLFVEDLVRSEKIVVCNALRGALPARLVAPARVGMQEEAGS
ncbi:MAG: pabB [Paucimonas sp.]|nr:pabB [Paucimonas sp.]